MKLISVEAAAAKVGCSTRQFRHRRESAPLPIFAIGKKQFCRVSDLEAWIAAQPKVILHGPQKGYRTGPRFNFSGGQ